jgi:FkbM family methyltransferase
LSRELLRDHQSRHPVRTVLDIGAHAGFFSVHALNTYPDAIIHAYEPKPNMKEFLEHQSGIGGFTYLLEAVGNKDDTVLLDRREAVSPHKVPSGR